MSYELVQKKITLLHKQVQEHLTSLLSKFSVTRRQEAAGRSLLASQRHYVYFCTSKASKLSTVVTRVRVIVLR